MNYKVMMDLRKASKEEWLKERKRGIGGSEAAAVCGNDKYKSILKVWEDKVTEEVKQEEEKEPAYWGKLLESLIAKEFTKRTGIKVRRRNMMFSSITHPFIIANIDRDVVGEDAFLECVSASVFAEKDWEDDAIPTRILYQVQHYMFVLGYSHCYIATLVGNKKFVWKRVERNELFISNMISEEVKFWFNNVIPKQEPELDASEDSIDYVNGKFPAAETNTSIKLDESYLPLVEDRIQLHDKIKLLEKEQDKVDNNIKLAIGDNETAYCGKYRISWKNCTRTTVDKTKIPPEIYNSSLKTTEYRKFEIK